MAKKMTARCRFQGRFPNSRTNCKFETETDALTAAIMAAPMVSAFRRTMVETYPDASVRPALKKLTITINFPTSTP